MVTDDSTLPLVQIVREYATGMAGVMFHLVSLQLAFCMHAYAEASIRSPCPYLQACMHGKVTLFQIYNKRIPKII